MNRIRTSKGSAILEDLLICLYNEGLGGSNLGKILRCRICKLYLIRLSVVSSHFQLHFIRPKF